MDAHSRNHDQERARKIGRWAFWGFALIAGYFLYTEHRAHLFSALPFLLLAACPLMHLFHHHGGHHHGNAGDDGGQDRQRDQTGDAAGQSGANPHHH